MTAPSRADIDRFLGLPPEQRRAFLRRAGASQHRPAVRARTSWPAAFPATPGQVSQWFLWRLDPRSPAYNVVMAYAVRGPLDVPALEAALAAVAGRHESLRTTFDERQGEVVQLVHREPVIDTAVAPAASFGEAAERARVVASEPFDLRAGPLVRCRVFSAGDAHALVLTFPHIVIDERSSRIVEEELAQLYEAAVAGERASLPPLHLQYGDHALALTGEDWSEDATYWQGRLRGAAASTLRPSATRPGGAAGAAVETEVDDAAATAVDALARAAGVTPFAAWGAVLTRFLTRCTGRSDVTWGTPVSGRWSAELQRVVGYFLNAVTVRVADPGASPVELAAEVGRAVNGAVRHGRMPFQEVVRVTRAVRAEPGALPFQVLFVHLGAEQTPRRFCLAGTRVEPLGILPDAPTFDLNVAVVEAGRRPTLVLRYANAAFDRATVEAWASDFLDCARHLRP